MSHGNVEIVHKTTDAFRRGDRDTVSAYIDPHISVRTDPSWPEQRFYGRDALLDWWRSPSEVWGSDIQSEEIVDLYTLLEYFLDHDRALKAVGLSDQAISQEDAEIMRRALLEHDERVALVDGLTLLAADLHHGARVFGLDGHLHLHRLEDRDGVALLDRVADGALDFPYGPGDMGLDLGHGSAQ